MNESTLSDAMDHFLPSIIQHGAERVLNAMDSEVYDYCQGDQNLADRLEVWLLDLSDKPGSADYFVQEFGGIQRRNDAEQLLDEAVGLLLAITKHMYSFDQDGRRVGKIRTNRDHEAGLKEDTLAAYEKHGELIARVAKHAQRWGA